MVADLSDLSSTKQIVEEAIKKFGKINVLVNSAGVIKGGGIESLKMDEYDSQMNINVKSLLQLTQNCLPHLIEQKGSVVNVSSVTGTRSFPGVLTYCMSKASVDQFTKCAALG